MDKSTDIGTLFFAHRLRDYREKCQETFFYKKKSHGNIYDIHKEQRKINKTSYSLVTWSP